MPEQPRASTWLRRQWRELLAAARHLLQWPRGLYTAALVLAVVGLAALLGVAAGLAPVNASAGHWPVTRVLLHWAMTRATRVRALSVTAPDGNGAADRLTPPDAQARQAAGHYATGCLACHGGPGHPRSRIVLHMTPEPPWLPDTLDKWDARELFHIVRHGVKYTAMPAWPGERRDDEIWAMVEFLQRMPGMSPQEFAVLTGTVERDVQPQPMGELAAPAAVPGPAASAAARAGAAGPGDSPGERADAAGPAPDILAGCARCHGVDGRGDPNGAFPRLDGQSEAYLLASLQAFAGGDRHSGIMEPAVRGLDGHDLRALARHFARQPAGPPAASPAATPDALARGRELAHTGDPRRRIPACIECHGPAGDHRNPRYPRIAGQYPGYLARQLELFQSHSRGGSGYQHLMHLAAHSLDPADIHDLSLYYASLDPDPP
ncbi:c-type cytochrome [Lysobacter sp. GX 14042]|uniref:c-type cytochrome n=1 Tax=Lysobacter sp. GX 14042 TaxID=2907155 RepID=UPI001F40F627|nr:c-type cytochrome [Lysobacter sp. GX 14042]MCE7032727.1 c-type cytochrome [Lysobacter sp. GX 14042]